MNINCSPSAIGRRIADLRREVGFTQGGLAEKADISVVHLSNIELGKKMPGLSTLIRIAETLNVATDWILRANTPGTYAMANEKIGELLADCTNDEMLSILRILEEVKNAMRHNCTIKGVSGTVGPAFAFECKRRAIYKQTYKSRARPFWRQCVTSESAARETKKAPPERGYGS